MGDVNMNNLGNYFTEIDFSRIVVSCSNTISTKEATSDILPIEWENNILYGEKKAIVTII